MRYEVPQFADIKTKIVGFLTVRQFLYVAVGSTIVYILFKSISLFWTFVFGLPIAGLAGALAFAKVNGAPFEEFLVHALHFGIRPKFYIWKKELPKSKKVTYQETDDNG